jgi:hypothetical protein
VTFVTPHLHSESWQVFGERGVKKRRDRGELEESGEEIAFSLGFSRPNRAESKW